MTAPLPQTAPTTPGTNDASRFGRLLALLLLAGAAAQGLMICEFLAKHPAAMFPLADGEVYWDMARDMMAGRWMGDTPFLSAPLYPYFLGVMRWLGTTLPALYFTQAAMLVISAGVLACVARKRFGDNVGLISAAIFLLLSDTAISTTRVLGNCVQLLLVVLLWQQWAALSERTQRRGLHIAACGVLLGLFALTYPAAMLLVPVFGIWLWRDSRLISANNQHRLPLGHAALGMACAIAAIAPATIHNWIVSHEFIAITAHGGVTLCHGNQPQSKGTYMPIPGVAPGRIGLHETAAKVYEQQTGQPATWRGVDRYFQGRAVDFWLAQPTAAVKLFAAKAYAYFTWRHYDDICITALDRELGFANASWLAPLAVPWVMGLALVGLITLRRDLFRFTPEWIVPALTLLVVVIFFYSPRYRLPATPMLATLAAVAIVRWRTLGIAKPIAIGLAVLLPALSVLNEAMHYDDPQRALKTYNHVISATYLKIAAKERKAGDQAAARIALLAAVRIEPESIEANRDLAMLLAQTNQLTAARELFEKIVALRPGDLRALRDLFHASLSLGDDENAKETLRKILVIKPDSAVIHEALDAWMNEKKRPGMLPPVEKW